MERGDLDTLEELTDPDFYYTHRSGRTEDKQAYLDFMRTSGARYHDVTRFDDKVYVHGSVALLRGNTTMRVELPKEARTVEVDNIFTAVWKWTDRGWRIIAYTSTPIAKRTT
jgi:hypothetical protein